MSTQVVDPPHQTDERLVAKFRKGIKILSEKEATRLGGGGETAAEQIYVWRKRVSMTN